MEKQEIKKQEMETGNKIEIYRNWDLNCYELPYTAFACTQTPLPTSKLQGSKVTACWFQWTYLYVASLLLTSTSIYTCEEGDSFEIEEIVGIY